MSSRDAILSSLRRASPVATPRPLPGPRPPAPGDLVAALGASLQEAGGRLECADGPAAGCLSALLPDVASSAHRYSSVAGIESRGAGAAARAPKDLAGLEHALLRGELAVAENGAVWHRPAGPIERAAALLAEHLVLVVPRACVVANLHDAYARIDAAAAAFGWFLSGPSKTADIEQALVLGAHGPLRLTLVLDEP